MRGPMELTLACLVSHDWPSSCVGIISPEVYRTGNFVAFAIPATPSSLPTKDAKIIRTILILAHVKAALGTYSVITSVIARVHPNVGMNVSAFSSFTGSNVSVDTFWAGVRSYMERFSAHAGAGTYAYFMALVKPWYDELAALGIFIAPKTTY
ncbi:uncharacterized protein N7498_007269 [Penicillium cinerascens]|uniref:Uncharacterized protein n=1 Tax=Penicillium cinerascens TaxID=70096 RepID=A0A9W9JKK3_9EURO|nr:uncharacterized protein N7498_007269 [Penicillium cinerascens]KAJ5198152.1 hypothetical protein N7498_007269 [Penicillium cinerascens]